MATLWTLGNYALGDMDGLDLLHIGSITGNTDYSVTPNVLGKWFLQESGLNIDVKNGSPVISMHNTDSALNEKIWKTRIADDGRFLLFAYQDNDVTAGEIALQITRSAENVTDIELPSGTLTHSAPADVSLANGLLTIDYSEGSCTLPNRTKFATESYYIDATAGEAFLPSLDVDLLRIGSSDPSLYFARGNDQIRFYLDTSSNFTIKDVFNTVDRLLINVNTGQTIIRSLSGSQTILENDSCHIVTDASNGFVFTSLTIAPREGVSNFTNTLKFQPAEFADISYDRWIFSEILAIGTNDGTDNGLLIRSGTGSQSFIEFGHGTDAEWRLSFDVDTDVFSIDRYSGTGKNALLVDSALSFANNQIATFSNSIVVGQDVTINDSLIFGTDGENKIIVPTTSGTLAIELVDGTDLLTIDNSGNVTLNGDINYKGVQDIDTDTRYLKGTNTGDEIFSALDSYIPTTGDKMPLNGGHLVGSTFIIWVYATRTSSSNIRIETVNTATGDSIENIVEGDTVTKAVVLSW